MKRCRIEGCDKRTHSRSGHCVFHYWFPPRPNFEDGVLSGNGHSKIRVTIDGVTKSINDWAEHPLCNVSSSSIRVRLQNGIDPKVAVFTRRVTPSKKKKPAPPPRGLTVNGETRTYEDWAADPRCGVAANTIKSRLALGWNPERAVFEPNHNKGARCQSNATNTI